MHLLDGVTHTCQRVIHPAGFNLNVRLEFLASFFHLGDLTNNYHQTNANTQAAAERKSRWKVYIHNNRQM